MFGKLNIFEKEWLDVVFETRNKDYGAYELRKLGPKATSVALLVVMFVVTAFSVPSVVDLKLFSADVAQEVEEGFAGEVTLETLIEEHPEEQPLVKEEARIAETKPAMDVIAFVEIKPVPKDMASSEEVVSADEAKDKKKLIGAVSIKGMKGGSLVAEGKWGKKDVVGEVTGSSTGKDTGGVVDFQAVEVQPDPIGGMAAFRAWIGKNYKYPQGAIDAGVKGVVQVTFVVEKDGSLTDIKVNRDLLYGTGEEAVRLLGRAAKWNAGIQNGVPVRVSYTLPIKLDLSGM